MSEIIGVITSVEDDSYDGKDFKKVTLDAGQVLKVKYGKEGKLKAKWDILQENVAVKFIMGNYQGKPFVSDIETVDSALPPPKEPQILPQHADAIEQAKAESDPVDKIERSMFYKEAGKLYRGGFLDDAIPELKVVKKKYFNRLFKALGIDVQYKL